MKRFAALLAVCLTVLAVCPGDASPAGSKLVSETGSLLRGKVYKQSGMVREGVITIRTTWNLPAAPPVFRYDFDILYGTVEGTLYSFLMGDIAAISFTPAAGGDQVLNIMLRNGVGHRIVLTTESKGLLGPRGLWITDLSVITDEYGENLVPLGEIERIEIYPPAQVSDEDIPTLVDRLGKALDVGARDGLVDKEYATVLEKLQKRMKARLLYEKTRQ